MAVYQRVSSLTSECQCVLEDMGAWEKLEGYRLTTAAPLVELGSISAIYPPNWCGAEDGTSNFPAALWWRTFSPANHNPAPMNSTKRLAAKEHSISIAPMSWAIEMFKGLIPGFPSIIHHSLSSMIHHPSSMIHHPWSMIIINNNKKHHHHHHPIFQHGKQKTCPHYSAGRFISQ